MESTYQSTYQSTNKYSYQKMGIFIYMSYILSMQYFMLAFCLYSMIKNPSYLYFHSLLLFYYIDVCSTYEKILILKAIIFMIMYNNSEKVNKKLNKLNIIRQSLMTLEDTDAKDTNVVLYYVNKGEITIKNKFNIFFSKVDKIITNIKNNKNIQNIISIVDNYLNIFISKTIEKHKELYEKLMTKLFNLDKKNKEINDEIDNNLKEIDNLMLELEQLKEENNNTDGGDDDGDGELDEDYKNDIKKDIKNDIIKQKESLEFIKSINFKQMMETIMKVKDMKVKKTD
jgi:hypothetical protein